MTVWVGLFLALAAGPLDAGALDAEARFVAARDAFGAFDLDAAKAGFAELSKDEALGPDARAIATVWLGLTEAELGEFASAEQTFQRALVMDRDVSLPPDASPKVVEMFEGVRTALAAATAGDIASPVVAPAIGDEADGVSAVEPAADGETDVGSPEPADVAGQESVEEAEPFAFGPLLLVGGLAASGFGVISVVAAGGLGVSALIARQQAENSSRASETQAANELMLSSAAGGNIFAAVGAGLVVTGAGLLVGSIFGGW